MMTMCAWRNEYMPQWPHHRELIMNICLHHCDLLSLKLVASLFKFGRFVLSLVTSAGTQSQHTVTLPGCLTRSLSSSCLCILLFA